MSRCDKNCTWFVLVLPWSHAKSLDESGDASVGNNCCRSVHTVVWMCEKWCSENEAQVVFLSVFVVGQLQVGLEEGLQRGYGVYGGCKVAISVASKCVCVAWQTALPKYPSAQ